MTVREQCYISALNKGYDEQTARLLSEKIAHHVKTARRMRLERESRERES